MWLCKIVVATFLDPKPIARLDWLLCTLKLSTFDVSPLYVYLSLRWDGNLMVVLSVGVTHTSNGHQSVTMSIRQSCVRCNSSESNVALACNEDCANPLIVDSLLVKTLYGPQPDLFLSMKHWLVQSKRQSWHLASQSKRLLCSGESLDTARANCVILLKPCEDPLRKCNESDIGFEPNWTPLRRITINCSIHADVFDGHSLSSREGSNKGDISDWMITTGSLSLLILRDDLLATCAGRFDGMKLALYQI
ncbi:hypothetical protein Tco_0058683 [Tanacetum coccineum]